MKISLKRFRWAFELVTVLGAVVAIVISLYSLRSDRRDDADARSSAARAARLDVIRDVLQMGEYDAEGGLSNQDQIQVLAADSLQLIEDFGQSRLDLSPVVYRLLAEYVSYSTNDVELAERMANYVLKFASPGSTELVLAHRVLGDVAAQNSDPEGLEREYDEALELNGAFRARRTDRGEAVDEFTLGVPVAQRVSWACGLLMTALLNSRRSASRHASGNADRAAIDRLAQRGRVPGQLRRLHVKESRG